MSDIAEVLGAILVVVGLGLMWLPLAFVAAGGALIAAGYLSGDAG